MKNRKIVLAFILFLVAGMLILTTCSKDDENPVASGGEPLPPPVNPAILKINYLFTGSTLSTNTPLVFQIYDNKNHMTNQYNPLFVCTRTVASGSIAITNIPTGTYYLFMFRDINRSGTPNDCQDKFSIYTNFYWFYGEGEPDATPVTIPAGETTTIDLRLRYSTNFSTGAVPADL